MAGFDWESVRAAAPASAEVLTRSASTRTCAAGEHLFVGGEPADAVWFVSEGVLRVFEGRPGEPQFTVKILAAPVTLGMVEVLNATSYVASAEALRPASAVRVPADVFRAAVARDPELARTVLTDVAAKFEGTMRLLGGLGFDDAEVRVCRALLEYARHFARPVERGLEIRFPLPRERLAREVGTARRTVDRALRTLRALELVWPSPKGWQVIASVEALQAHIVAKAAKNAASATR